MLPSPLRLLFRRHRGCTKGLAPRPRVTVGFMCRKCLCTRFEHAIHVLVALWHYARHCCSAVLSLYDRLCSLLSPLLPPARARVTRVFCIPFCFSLSICFSGGDLWLSVPNCAAFTASPRRWTRVPRVPHVRPRGRLAIPCRFSTIVIDRFSTIVIGTIVIVFINARRPSPWPEALRCESGQCDRLVERRLRISD